MTTRYIASVPGAPAPAAPYSTAVVAGNTCYVSGQVALGPDGALAAGDVVGQAQVTLRNLQAALEGAGFSLADVVTVTVLLADIADFASFNEEYAKWFQPDRLPARIAYQVGALPLGAQVEVQCVAVRGE